jgi:hypothetical protein
MAFVNLPPNLQDMFYALSDRISKLETGPNQAMYTAEAAQGGAQSASAQATEALTIALSSQSVATQAEIDAINAGIQANNAASQATLASSQATQAQASANGKNTIYYGTTSTPGTGTVTNATGNGTTITYTAYNGLQVGQTVTVSGIANNTASISGATGDGSTITYTGSNNFAIGQTVTVTGINPSRWNATGVITAASGSSFSIAGATTGTPAYISGGSASAPSLLNTTGTVATQSFTQFTIASTRRGNYTSGGSLNVSGLVYQVGDIYFQYNTSSQVIAQSTWNGSAWQSTPITNTVITNLDAGKITTGIITSIEYNNGSGTFRVTPAGALTASSANITGTINATTGYFGNPATGNYWSIGSSGLTAVGSGTITGGLIQGSSITVPNSSAWKFAVDSAGSLQAVNANITGAITATSGSFTGAITAQSGSITGALTVTGSLTGGTIQTSSGSNAVILDGPNNALGIKYGGSYAGFLLGIGSGAFMMHYGTAPDIVNGYPRVSVSSSSSILAANGSNSLSVTTSGNNMQGAMTFGSTVTVNSSLTGNSSATFGSGSLLFEFLSSSGNVRVAQTYNQAVSGRAMQISSAGLYGTTASTERKKHNINLYAIDTNTLLQLEPVSFNYIESIDEEQNPEYGFIAEDADRLGLYELVGYDKEGLPDYFAYEKLPVFLLQLAKEQEARIKALEGK